MAAAQKIRSFATSPVLWSFVVKGANAVGSFAVTILLARIAGAEIVGQYALAFTTATLVGLVPLRGLDTVAIRAISGDVRVGRQAEARGAAGWFWRTILWSAVPAALLFALAILYSPVVRVLDGDAGALLAASIGVASVALFRMGLSLIRALNRPVSGQFFEALPSVVLAAVLLGLALAGTIPPLWLVVAMMFCGQLVAALLALLLFGRSVSAWPRPTVPDAVQRRAWQVAGIPLMGVALVHQFFDWFLLAATTGFATAAEAGAFRAAVQVLMLVAVIFITAETYVAPRLGGDLRAGAIAMAWRRQRRATALMLALAGPILLACLLVPTLVMETLFGPEFASAGPALRIMAIGQLLNVATGPVGIMMVMAGHERIQFLLALSSAVVLVLLGLLLIPRLGLEGAAIAYAGAFAVRNIGSYALARHFIRPDRFTTSDRAAP